VSSDTSKTLISVAVAGSLAAIAYFTYPWIPPIEPSADIGKPLFDQERFTVENVATLEIVRYDSAADRFSEFKVTRDRRGIWTIPSSDGYPADAEEQMRTAITSLEGLTIVDVIPDSENLFEEFGVLEPDRADTAVGQTGVGTLVTVSDAAGETIGSLIIGNSDENQPNLRFVRRPGQPLIFVVDYDPTVLKTDFRDWIDKDLLQIDAVDIARLDIDDYQVLIPEAGDAGRRFASIQPRFRAAVRSQGTRWELERFLEYVDPNEPTERTVGAEEELNQVRLNQVASSLDTLEIVDVVRKPSGLGVDLKAIDTAEEILDLNASGYVPAQAADGSLELKSVNGDLFVDTADGLRYTLRFGNIRQGEGAAGSLDRYMMVAVSVNESAFPMPELPALPDIGLPGGDAPAPGDSPEGAPMPDGGAPAPGDGAPTPTPAGGTDMPAGGGDAPASETPATETPASETPAGEPDDGTVSRSDRPAASPVAFVSTVQESDDEATRRRDAEYRRLVDERNTRLDNARRRVEELNGRFGDWYYVVSEKSFKEIRIERSELIVPRGTGAADPNANPGLPPGIPGLPGLGGPEN